MSLGWSHEKSEVERLLRKALSSRSVKKFSSIKLFHEWTPDGEQIPFPGEIWRSDDIAVAVSLNRASPTEAVSNVLVRLRSLFDLSIPGDFLFLDPLGLPSR